MEQFLSFNAFSQLASTGIDFPQNIETFFQKSDRALYAIDASKRATLTFLLEISKQRLETLSAQTLLCEKQNDIIHQELLLISFFIRYQIRLDKIEGKRENLEALNKNLKKCCDLAQLYLNDAQFVAYDLTPEIRPGKTQVLKSYIGHINMTRLYWVFARSWTESCIDNFSIFSKTRALTTLPGNWPGRLSWGLYFSRLGVELGLLLKHTFPNPLMKSAEKDAKLSCAERFDIQWQARKYVILNDLVWAPINALGYFVLVGGGRLGQINNIVSIVAFMYDAAITAFKYEETRQAYNVIEKALEESVRDLKKSYRHEQNGDVKAKLQYLLSQAKYDLKRFKIKKQTELESLKNDLIYSIVLVLGITLMGGFGLPLTFFTPEMMNLYVLIGASLCFAGNIANSIWASCIKYTNQEAENNAKIEHQNTQFQQAAKIEKGSEKFLYAPQEQNEAAYELQSRRCLSKMKAQEIQSNLVGALFPGLMLLLGVTCAPMTAQLLFVGSVLAYKYYNAKEETPSFSLAPSPSP